MRAAPVLFRDWQAVAFSHHVDGAQGGVEGLAHRALHGDRTEFVVHEVDLVHLLGEVVLHEPARQLLLGPARPPGALGDLAKQALR